MDRRSIAVALGAFLTVGGAAAAHSLRNQHALPTEVVRLESFPFELPPFRGIDLEVSDRVKEELRSDALLLREYAAAGEWPIWLYVDYHRTQRIGAQIHSPRNCYPGAGWSVLEAWTVDRLVGARERPLCWLILSDSEGNRRVAVFWFETRWGASTQELSLKRDLLRSAVARRPTDAALVRLSTDTPGQDPREAVARLEGFLDRLGEPLDRELPFGRDVE